MTRPAMLEAPRLFGVWWLSPPVAALMVLPVTLALAFVAPDARYRALWGTPKALTTSATLLLATGILAVVAGSLWPSLLRRREVRQPASLWPGDQQRVVDTALVWLFRGTMFGYLALLLIGVSRGVRPGDLLGALLSADVYTSGLKSSFAPVAGVSTFTQLGPAFVILAMLELRHGPDRQLRRRIGIVVGLGALRGYLLSERLALLEVLLPLVVIAAIRAASHPVPWRRAAARLAPVALVPVVAGVFSLFEYARSWQFYSRTSDLSFPRFVLERFSGYYATAYNNGQLYRDHGDFPGRLPYSSLEAVWTAPGFEQVHAYQRLTGRDPDEWRSAVLAQHGNPEFNNPGGLVAPFFDWGPVGGVLFLLLIGSLLGLAYRSLRLGRPAGLLLYPLLMTGLFELPRYLYWTQGRVLPSLLALGFLAWRLERRAPLRRARWRVVAA